MAKLIAAKEAKQDQNFMIIARVEGLIAGLGMNETIKRAKAYEKAGADAIIIHSKKNTADEIFEFSDSWNGNIPLIAIPTSYPLVSIDELIEHKIKMVIYANQTLRAAHNAISNLLSQLSKAKSLDEIKLDLSTMEDIFHLQQMYNIKNQEKIIEENLRKMGYLN